MDNKLQNINTMLTTIKAYKTNVQNQSNAKMMAGIILSEYPDSDVNFDLEDCDNVLRVERFNGSIDDKIIKRIFEMYGYSIELLPL